MFCLPLSHWTLANILCKSFIKYVKFTLAVDFHHCWHLTALLLLLQIYLTSLILVTFHWLVRLRALSKENIWSLILMPLCKDRNRELLYLSRTRQTTHNYKNIKEISQSPTYSSSGYYYPSSSHIKTCLLTRRKANMQTYSPCWNLIKCLVMNVWRQIAKTEGSSGEKKYFSDFSEISA